MLRCYESASVPHKCGGENQTYFGYGLEGVMVSPQPDISTHGRSDPQCPAAQSGQPRQPIWRLYLQEPAPRLALFACDKKLEGGKYNNLASGVSVQTNLVFLSSLQAPKDTPPRRNMLSFASLPGELTAIIRECIPCSDLTTHLSLHVAAGGARLALYDESIWRELCHANGFGGMFSEAIVEGWRKSILILARYQERMGASHSRRYGPLQWTKASVPAGISLAASTYASLVLNPAFASLSFDRRGLVAGQGLAATYLHSRPACSDSRLSSRTVADQIEDATPTQLTHHIGAYALATATPVTHLDILFDHWGSDLDGNTAKEACSFSSELARVQREDGVRVVDVVEGILKW